MKTTNTISHIEQLDIILGPGVTRHALRSALQRPVQRPVRLSVLRTMPIEWLDVYINGFARLWGASVQLESGDYDASLSNIAVYDDKTTDVYVLWLDWRYYRETMTPGETADWLKQRLHALRARTTKPILVNNWPDHEENGDELFAETISERAWNRRFNLCMTDMATTITGMAIIDLSLLAAVHPEPFFDRRNELLSNFPFSSSAITAISRHLGVQLLPAVLTPRIKAIIVDLDDTLYQGVLGEDGVDHVVLTEGHRKLQHGLSRLQRSGILLAVCSKNAHDDVKQLFAQRTDFPLQWDDFAVVCANWHPKSDNVQDILHSFNFDASAALFIDDSMHELLNVASAHPTIHLLRADGNSELTALRLSRYPSLYMLEHDTSASMRTQDIRANQERNRMKKEASDTSSYLASLEMKIELFHNEPAHMARLYELSRKTNQFNLTLLRMNETEAEQYVLQRNQYAVFTVKLSDKLGDSGIIGAWVFEYAGERARLREAVFSCRALGREVETVSFYRCLKWLASRGVLRLSVDVQQGPRNEPARAWLNRYERAKTDEGYDIHILLQMAEAVCSRHPAIVIEHGI